MSTAMIEIDFFGIEKQNHEKALYEKNQDQRRTFRGIQNAMSKIDPHILKTVFANGSFDGRNEETRASPRIDWICRQIPPAPPARQPIQVAPFPQATMMPLSSFSWSATETPNEMAKIVTENANDKAPFTIIYNGTVVTFDLSQDKAETILELARNGIMEGHESVKSNFADLTEDGRQLLENLKGDLPIARKQSLQRFLEKRRERLISLSPYSGRSTFEDKKWFMESVRP